MTPPPSAAPVLEARSVSKQFSSTVVLHAVDLAVRPGSIHALVGENGAGKSTLIKVLTGVYRPDEGEVLLRGDRMDFHRPADSQRAGISTVYQEVNLVPLLSVARNIFLGREPRGALGLIDTRALHRRAEEVLADLGIDVDVRADLGTLGLGVQQMIALARAVTIDAKAVIMDEPTSSLERREVDVLFRVARRLRDSGVGLIFVSHRLDELWELCDEVTILRDGRVVHTGAMADLDRRTLVSHMLGRPIEDIAAHGSTSFGDGDGQRVGDTVLHTAGLAATGRLQGVGFDVRAGEVVGLAGLLGAGRSETVKAIYGDLSTSHGEVDVRGRRVRRGSVPAALDAGIALLSEDRKAEGIVPDLSVRDNIVLAVLGKVSRAGVISDRRIDELVQRWIERLRIKVADPRQPVSELSGGNQQKVLLARWLSTEPVVFLLDEPTRGIDVGAKREVQSLIDELAGDGLAVVLISSETEELVEGSDRIVVLRDGAVVDTFEGGEVSEQRLLRALVGPAPANGSPDGDDGAPDGAPDERGAAA